jgi:heme-degrading monooxygenase HmoA
MRGIETMIIREWRGRAVHQRADAYPKHFRERVLPGLRKIPGFIGAHLCERQLGLSDKVEFLVLTRWESMDAIRSFAGPSVDVAVVEPAAVAALADFDDTVQHYAVIEEVSGG